LKAGAAGRYTLRIMVTDRFVQSHKSEMFDLCGR
jgi:hypothetical protein